MAYDEIVMQDEGSQPGMPGSEPSTQPTEGGEGTPESSAPTAEGEEVSA